MELDESLGQGCLLPACSLTARSHGHGAPGARCHLGQRTRAVIGGRAGGNSASKRDERRGDKEEPGQSIPWRHWGLLGTRVAWKGRLVGKSSFFSARSRKPYICRSQW